MHFIKNFKRVEQKYLLTQEQFLSLKNLLEEYFEKDKYYECKIYNLYFDNDNNDMIINSIEKPQYKDKIRVRSYLEPKLTDNVFLEIKQKYKGVVYKRRVSMTLKDFNDYMKKGILPDSNNQIMKELDYYINYYKLHPKVFVAYDRLSYYSKEDVNFRITFDTNLRSRIVNLKLKDTKENKLYFNDKIYVMEVKSLYSLPLWFTNALSQNKIFPRSFSKVGSIYKKERGINIC